MNNILRKLTSRKLWLAIIGIAMSVYLALGGDPTSAEKIMGLAGVIVSSMTYIIVEGKVDAVNKVAESTQTAIGVIESECK